MVMSYIGVDEYKSNHQTVADTTDNSTTVDTAVPAPVPSSKTNTHHNLDQKKLTHAGTVVIAAYQFNITTSTFTLHM